MINRDTLTELLSYDPETGILIWKFRERKWFNSDRVWKLWNTKFAGKEAFTSVGSHGYNCGMIFNVKYNKHVIIWIICFDETPEIIDHEDGDKQNCRLTNLRSTDNSGNSKNKAFSKNSSGFMGVYWDKKRKKWRATIKVDKSKHLGYFENFEDACRVRKDAELKYGFHPNHGRLKK